MRETKFHLANRNSLPRNRTENYDAHNLCRRARPVRKKLFRQSRSEFPKVAAGRLAWSVQSREGALQSSRRVVHVVQPGPPRSKLKVVRGILQEGAHLVSLGPRRRCHRLQSLAEPGFPGPDFEAKP